MKLLNNISNFMERPIPKLVFTTKQRYDNEIKTAEEFTKQRAEFDQFMMAFEFGNVLFEVAHISLILASMRSFGEKSITESSLNTVFEYMKCYELMDKHMKKIEECNPDAVKDIRRQLDRICTDVRCEAISLDDLYTECQNFIKKLEEENKNETKTE